jgi:hypothetical protein
MNRALRARTLKLADRIGLTWPGKGAILGRIAYTIPLWLPFSVLGLSTAACFLLDRRRPYNGGVCEERQVRLERLSPVTSLVLSATAFLVLLLVMPLMIDAVGLALCYPNYYTRWGALSTPTLVILMLFSLLVPYLCARFLHSKLRWRILRTDDAPHCQSCGYNLTGNVSGVCPECGEPCETDKITE